jgi:predicted NAD/FAD-dependent oxidoreductase
MPLVGKAHTRAFAFRDDTAAIRAERLRRSWDDVAPQGPAFIPSDLPYTPVALAQASIPLLVAECEIDHGVGPVSHTRGGSLAGYARWQTFKDSGRLSRYAARRNDATGDGVSRMSAYLHYGMVSPLRLARESAAMAGEGPEKYLDELLVWRELAYAFCYWHPSPTTIEAIPGWARETLAKHERDHRTELSWEALSRAQSGDALWDATQMSLLRHGELHNNVRMTWGKAIPLWTANAEQALERLVDLNHRYALDGRDPASYGGLLWCLGQFDRPFTPPVRVLGTVRPRTTADHAKRLDIARYSLQVMAPSNPSAPSVLIIGAGMTGLACARTLADHGCQVSVLEKGRGVGGRLSHRREGEWRFDHGAQRFQMADSRTAPFVDSWLHDGVLMSHGDDLTGRSGMTALPKHLASGLPVQTGVQVQSLQRDAAGWTATDQNGQTYVADALVLAIPAPQATALLRTAAPDSAMLTELASVRMLPCWSTMVVFDAPPPTRITEQLVHGAMNMPSDERLAHCSREADKTGRPAAEAWVVHSSAEWSVSHLERAASDIAAEVAQALRDALGIAGSIVHATSHRWRYARVSHGLTATCLWDPALQLGAAGDFAQAMPQAASDVERAWLSGVAMAGRILGG